MFKKLLFSLLFVFAVFLSNSSTVSAVSFDGGRNTEYYRINDKYGLQVEVWDKDRKEDDVISIFEYKETGYLLGKADIKGSLGQKYEIIENDISPYLFKYAVPYITDDFVWTEDSGLYIFNIKTGQLVFRNTILTCGETMPLDAVEECNAFKKEKEKYGLTITNSHTQSLDYEYIKANFKLIGNEESLFITFTLGLFLVAVIIMAVLAGVSIIVSIVYFVKGFVNKGQNKEYKKLFRKGVIFITIPFILVVCFFILSNLLQFVFSMF